MSTQLILRRLPTSLQHEVFARTLALEDVLVSTVFGALAYGPPELLQAWRRRFTTMPPMSRDLRFEFWPTGHVVGGMQREPDVFLLDSRRGDALIVEAKRGLPKPELLVPQLLEEGLAARGSYAGIRLHLLVVSEPADPSRAFAEVTRLRPRLFASRVRHATWADLCEFLRAWSGRPGCHAGDRRLIADALAVMAKYGWA